MSLIVTNNIVNQKFGIPVPNFFVCSMFKENWSICKKHKLWGVPENSTAATSAIKRVKPGDYLIFRLNKGPDYVAIWLVTSKPFVDKKEGPWKRENPDETRNFIWQVKMHPLLTEEFVNPVKLNYENGLNKETGIKTISYMSGMVEITSNQYEIISKKLINNNLNHLHEREEIE